MKTVNRFKINLILILSPGLKCVEGDDMKSYISFDANEFYLEVYFGQSSDFKAEVRRRLGLELV